MQGFSGSKAISLVAAIFLLVLIMAWLLNDRKSPPPGIRKVGVDRAALETQELLAQYQHNRRESVDDPWPPPTVIQTKLLAYVKTTTTPENVRVDYYRALDEQDSRVFAVELLPDKNLLRVEIRKASPGQPYDLAAP